MQQLQHIFGDGGLLSQHIDGYEPRSQQQEMALTIADTLLEGSVLIAEAGTGTGKTFAYLVPAILSGQKVMVSTGTKNLQDQLFRRDLPLLRKALGVPFKAALLKGRSNYLCHYRLNQAKSDPVIQFQTDTLQELTDWSAKTTTGDLSESDLLDSNSSLWSKVTSTVDNCLGQECPDFTDCFISAARRKAQEADLVIINHHLLMSDMALKSAGHGEVLPSADAYIIDEAHQLPDIASQFLGHRVSTHQLLELARDSIVEMEQNAADMSDIRYASEKLNAISKTFRLTLGEKEQRMPWHLLAEDKRVTEKLTELLECLENLAEQLELATARSKGLEQCHERSIALLETLSVFDSKEGHEGLILWADIHANGVVMNATPHNVSHYFQQWMEAHGQAWVFTSATLTVAGKFNNFCHQLGIEDPETVIWSSPFNYQQQSLLYMPSIPVEPNNEDYSSHIIDVSKDIISHSRGRTFLLFTSYKALNLVAKALEDLPFPLLIQGSASKTNLLNDFREHGNAVLLGTNSFWEGVDVRGEALSCVLIDKIPFASPGDPVLQARIDYLKERGGNPFTTIQIPSAVIQLKQGIGRLIRDSKDFGVLVLCDPRFLSKPYGKLFLRSLPAMPITQNSDDVRAFFAQKVTAEQ